METRLIIIDLHCDPTMPAGANEAGGGNVYMRQLLHGLVSTGIRATYITRKKYPELESSAVISNGIDFYRLELGDWGPNDKAVLQKYYSEAIYQIRELLHQYNSDNFIFHSSYWQSGKLALDLSTEFKTVFVHTVLSNALRKGLQGGANDDPPERIPWEQEIFRSAKYVLCSSEAEAEDIITLYQIPKSNILVTGLVADPCFLHPDYDLYGSVALDRSFASESPKEKKIVQPLVCSNADNHNWWTSKSFLYFGRLHPDKGLDYIFEAWAMLYQVLGSKTPPLWIVGGTLAGIQDYRTRLQKIWKSLCDWESQHLVVWWGTLSPASIGTLLLKTQAVVTHSRYESAGLVILEAMTRGIPVLATPYGYGRDLVRNWHNGFQVSYGDVLSLYHRLLVFYSQPYLSHLMGHNARVTANLAAKNFRFVDKHLFAYGFRDRIEEESHFLDVYYTPDDLVAQRLDTFPFLISPVPKDRIEMVFEQFFGEKIIKLEPVLGNDADRFFVQTEAKTQHLAIRLSAHIRLDHLWNRYSHTSHVNTIAEQIDAIKQFGRDSGRFAVEWESTSEGLVILSIPDWSHVHISTLWTISSCTTETVDNLEARWKALSLLIHNTPELNYLLPELSQVSSLILRAISIEHNLPTVQYIPLSKPKLECASAIPFECAHYTSLPGFLTYANSMSFLHLLPLNNYDHKQLQEAEVGWRKLLNIWEACKKTMLHL